MSKEKRAKLKIAPSSQIDTDADATQKKGKKYFGYKGHIGENVGSGLIRKRSFTSARPHDSQEKENLWSGDEKAVFGDSAYSNQKEKHTAQQMGVYYGVSWTKESEDETFLANRRKGINSNQLSVVKWNILLGTWKRK